MLREPGQVCIFSYWVCVRACARAGVSYTVWLPVCFLSSCPSFAQESDDRRGGGGGEEAGDWPLPFVLVPRTGGWEVGRTWTPQSEL